jgi:hypothetical protein
MAPEPEVIDVSRHHGLAPPGLSVGSVATTTLPTDSSVTPLAAALIQHEPVLLAGQEIAVRGYGR